MKIILGILLGSFFGYALYKVEATNPKKLLAMLRLEDLKLAKVILFAIGLGSTLLAAAGGVGLFEVSHLDIKPLNTGVILGGIIFGLGFGYAGTCPGTCVGAIGGTGFKKALSGVAGGLLGAFTFSMVYEKLNETNWMTGWSMGKLTLFSLSPDFPAVFEIGWMGLGMMGILLMSGAYLLPKSILKE